MTYKRAYDIISEFCFTGYKDNKKPTGELFSAIHELVCEAEESTKLKAENKRLSSDNSWLVLAKAEKEFENVDLLEENAKLKVEIEAFKEEVLANKSWADVVERTLKKEVDKNEQLESELEQSIKLPCKVGDTVFIIGKCKDFPPKIDGTMWDSDGGFGTATGYYCPYEDSDLCPFKDLEDCSFAENELGIFEDVVCHICIEEEKMWYVCENSNGYETNDFGKTVFTTREEAEQSLKG